jgi:hypothetical protein
MIRPSHLAYYFIFGAPIVFLTSKMAYFQINMKGC